MELPKRIDWSLVGTEPHHKFHPQDIPQERILKAIKSRTFQTNQGNRTDNTEAAHHLNHSDMIKMIEDGVLSGMTNAEMLELAIFVDRATLVQAKEYNRIHTKLENEIRMNKKTGMEMSFEAKERVIRYISRVATAFCKGTIGESNTKRMIEFYKDVFYKQVPILKYYLDAKKSRVNRDPSSEARQFRGFCEVILSSVYKSIKKFVRKDQLYLVEGRLTPKSALVVNKFVVFTTSNKVDKRCKGFLMGIVDEFGVLSLPDNLDLITEASMPDLITESDKEDYGDEDLKVEDSEVDSSAQSGSIEYVINAVPKGNVKPGSQKHHELLLNNYITTNTSMNLRESPQNSPSNSSSASDLDSKARPRPTGYIINPTNKRKVKVGSKKYQELLHRNFITISTPQHTRVSSQESSAGASSSSSNAEYIKNPLTNRKVKVGSKLYQDLVKRNVIIGNATSISPTQGSQSGYIGEQNYAVDTQPKGKQNVSQTEHT